MRKITQNIGIKFNSVGEYIFNSLSPKPDGFDEFIPIEDLNNNGNIPDPVEYYIDDEFYNYLIDFLRSLNQQNIRSSVGIKRIYEFVKLNFKGSYLEYLILIFGDYFQDEIKEAVSNCKNVFELRENKKISIIEYKFVSEIYEYLCKSDKWQYETTRNNLFIISPKNYIEDIADFMLVYDNIKADFPKATYSASLLYNLPNWNSVLSSLGNSKFDNILILAHGNSDDGLIIDFKNKSDSEPLTNQRLSSLMPFLVSNGMVFLLGCNSCKYQENEFNYVNRISTSTGWSTPEMQDFIYGYFYANDKGNNLLNNFISGKMSLMLRAHSVCKIHINFKTHVVN